MRAVIIQEHGETDVLNYVTDFPEPKIRSTEILVEVKACAMNHLDIWVRRGQAGAKIPLPHILGCDIAGMVTKVGSEVNHVAPGDKVMLANGVSCGHCVPCLSGNDNLCLKYHLIGAGRHGGYAEFVAAPSANAIPIPEGMSFESAASIPLVLTTVWHMLVTRAQVRPGEDVLILAAGSGVGSMGIQVAKLLGTRVIATAGSDEKLERAKALGADEVINYSTHDFAAEVRKLTHKKGVEVVLEHTGEVTWEKSIASLARNGRLVTCGATSGYRGMTDIRALFAKHLTLYGSFMGSKAELLEAMKFVRSGQLKPVVDRTFPLEEAAQAHHRMMDRQQFGKLVLVP